MDNPIFSMPIHSIQTSIARGLKRVQWPVLQWREAFIVALSMTLAYGLAFYWQLDRPFWAGFSVTILAGLPTVGQSLQKGALRIGGTLLGGAVALCLMATFHQNHMGLLLALSLYMALTMYLMTGSPNLRYFYFIACIVTTIVVISAAQNPHQTFTLVVSRVEETLLGIGSHMAVSLLFMLPSSHGLLTSTLREIVDLHTALATSLPRTETQMATDFDLYSRLGSLLERATLLLPAVELENPNDYAARNFWKETLYVSRELAEEQHRWLREVLTVQDADIANLEAQRAVLCQAMASLGRAARLDKNKDFGGGSCESDSFKDENFAESPDERTHSCIQHQMQLMAQLHGLLRYLLHNATRPALPKRIPTTREALFIAPDRLRVAVQVLVQFWLLIPLWVFLNPPGLPTMTFVELALIMGMLSLFAGNISPLRLLKPFLVGIGCVFPLYMFVYPAITSPEVFLFLLFAGAFVLCTLFPRPDQAMARNGFMLPWLSIGHFTNMPVFNFADFANGATTMILSIVVVGTVHYALFNRDKRQEF